MRPNVAFTVAAMLLDIGIAAEHAGVALAVMMSHVWRGPCGAGMAPALHPRGHARPLRKSPGLLGTPLRLTVTRPTGGPHLVRPLVTRGLCDPPEAITPPTERNRIEPNRAESSLSLGQLWAILTTPDHSWANRLPLKSPDLWRSTAFRGRGGFWREAALLRLEVAMHDAPRVGVRDGLADAVKGVHQAPQAGGVAARRP